MGWKFIGMGRGFDGREEEMMERELEKAYRKGRRDERERMEERGGYGERGSYSGGSGRGSSGSSSGGYGQRDNMYYMDEDMEEEEYGERRGVEGTGPYSRYRYRRR